MSDTENIDIMTENAHALHKSGNLDEAEIAYRTLLLEPSNENFELLYNFGVLLYQKKKYAEAEQILLRTVNTIANPMNNYNPCFALAVLYEKMEKFDDAERYYNLGIEKGETVDCYINLGVIYQQKGDIAKAETYYKHAIEKEDYTAAHNLANMYRQNGNIDEAIRYYKLAIAHGIKESRANLGCIYEDQNNYAEAENIYMSGIENNDPICMLNLGIINEKKKENIEEAIKYYKMAIQNGCEKAMNNLGIIYECRGDLQEAKNYYLMAKNNPLAQDNFMRMSNQIAD